MRDRKKVRPFSFSYFAERSADVWSLVRFAPHEPIHSFATSSFFVNAQTILAGRDPAGDQFYFRPTHSGVGVGEYKSIQ